MSPYHVSGEMVQAMLDLFNYLVKYSPFKVQVLSRNYGQVTSQRLP